MIKVKAIRSDGVVFNYTSVSWKMLLLEGVDSPNIEIFKENKGLGNGAIITNRRKREREVKLITRLKNANVDSAERKRVMEIGRAHV